MILTGAHIKRHLNLLGRINSLLLICALFLFSTNTLFAQNCNPAVPHYNLDFTGNPDTVWNSGNVNRNNQCCSAKSNETCIWFTIMLDPMSQGFSVNVTGGTGTTEYQVSCGTPIPVGDIFCVNGIGPHQVTVCKPGGNGFGFTITTYAKPHIPDPYANLSFNCQQLLYGMGFQESTISWRALNSSYNSYLSCSTGCDSTYITAPSNAPSFADFEISGKNANTTCDTNTYRDTVRVYFYSNPTILISPALPKVCFGASAVTVSAQGSGGLPPYRYLWSNGSTSSSTSLSAGTHWVRIIDSLACVIDYDTFVVTQNPRIFATANNDTSICTSKNRVELSGTFTNTTGAYWYGGSGRWLKDSSQMLNSYVPSQSEISSGNVKLFLSALNNNNCSGETDSMVITINDAPHPSISGDMAICANATSIAYQTDNHIGSSYDWKVIGGSIASGQGTSNITVNWGTAGPGFIYVTETDNKNCYGIGSINPIAQYDFNFNPIGKATIGPDAASVDADAYSNGESYLITNNCGSTKGADLNIPSASLDRGKMCMSFSFQRDENDADFFTRGNNKFFLRGGSLRIQLSLINPNNQTMSVGPINTGYTIPNDDNFRYFTFCYDSASGKAVVMVNDSAVWSYQALAGYRLNWSGSGNGVLSSIMDGNCSGKPLIDWAIISVPISIIANPTPQISGATFTCNYNTETYIASNTRSGSSFTWNHSSGSALSSINDTLFQIFWLNNSTAQIIFTETNIDGCSANDTLNINLKSKPNPIFTGLDTVCSGNTLNYIAQAQQGIYYAWNVDSASILSSQGNDSVSINWLNPGLHNLELIVTDSATGCDSTYEFQVWVDSTPVFTLSGDNPVCLNEPNQTYQVSSSIQANYAWNLATGGNITANGNSANIIWNSIGNHQISVEALRPISGCSYNVDYDVKVYPKPQTSAISD